MKLQGYRSQFIHFERGKQHESALLTCAEAIIAPAIARLYVYLWPTYRTYPAAPLPMSARRVKADTAMGSEHRDRTAHRQRRAAHPIPACQDRRGHLAAGARQRDSQPDRGDVAERSGRTAGGDGAVHGCSTWRCRCRS
jgi:hypothetical protein